MNFAVADLERKDFVIDKAVKAAMEGLLADVVFELEAERSTRGLCGKRVTI